MSLGGPSFWLATTPETDYPKLTDGLEVDVAVVGAGITGITAAVLLKRAGKTVALIDSKRIVQGATGYTTAKVTSGHGANYTKIRKAFGADGARAYAQANEAALDWIARLIETNRIDCDFERRTNYVFAERDEEVAALRQEARGRAPGRARDDARRRDAAPVPGRRRAPAGEPGAVPPAQVPARASRRRSRATEATSSSRAGWTGSSTGSRARWGSVAASLRAADVILATHLPILDSGLFFAKAYPHRSYAVAAPLAGAPDPAGMYVNSGAPTRSIRTIRDGDRVLLQVGGNGHKVGEEEDTPARYDQLETFLREHWPAAGEVEYRWSTQDYMAHDRVPYVGRLRRRSEHLYAATGYSKWGMTNGTVAAMILSDAILGRREPLGGALRLEAASTQVLPRQLLPRERCGRIAVHHRLDLARRPGNGRRARA